LACCFFYKDGKYSEIIPITQAFLRHLAGKLRFSTFRYKTPENHHKTSQKTTFNTHHGCFLTKIETMRRAQFKDLHPRNTEKGSEKHSIRDHVPVSCRYLGVPARRFPHTAPASRSAHPLRRAREPQVSQKAPYGVGGSKPRRLRRCASLAVRFARPPLLCLTRVNSK
jgi:hypothetical protein